MCCDSNPELETQNSERNSKLVHGIKEFYLSLFTSFHLYTGCVSGLGYGFLIMTGLLVSGPYFREKRGLAIGLVAVGSGIGTFTIPYILRGLFTLYDFSRAMLLYGKYL